MVEYSYIALTVACTVYGQLILKWRVSQMNQANSTDISKIDQMLLLLLDPWIVSVAIAMFISAIAWMLAIKKYDLSYAYPFVSLTFVLVFIFSSILFNEPVNIHKVIGVSMITIGVLISSYG